MALSHAEKLARAIGKDAEEMTSMAERGSPISILRAVSLVKTNRLRATLKRLPKSDEIEEAWRHLRRAYVDFIIARGDEVSTDDLFQLTHQLDLSFPDAARVAEVAARRLAYKNDEK